LLFIIFNNSDLRNRLQSYKKFLICANFFAFYLHMSEKSSTFAVEMIIYPNCKINLGLRVVRKRPDGYHDLETIFVPVYGLHDVLEVRPSKGLVDDIVFEQEGISVDCNPEDNLIIKCYRNFAKKYDKVGGVSIRFKKNIPFGAGLGGGSSDAAHMAIALNELFELGLNKEELAKEVAPLGADCAFFIYNVPCFAEGIGDKLTPIDLDLKGTRIVMIKPEEGISTREAYSGITISGEGLYVLDDLDILENLDKCTNDFEATVFPKHPIIAQIKKRLLDAGAYYASMSGSGSTVFGFFKNDPEGRTDAKLAALKDEFAFMVLLDDTFGEWKS
jgi:4-diphosphocytidyl-2-C-methyl-D-erythritol kinase